MVRPLHIFIGYDPREAVAYHTCVQSIIENTKDPKRLQITPIRGDRRDGSNDFIYARFLVPYLCGFRGEALFLDGDMIVRGDIADLMDSGVPHGKALAVVQHEDYKTKYPTKYLGNTNQNYPRKNWSSVIFWRCDNYAHRVLMPEFVAKREGSYLHRFGWLKDNAIGSLGDEWNRLVLEQPVTDNDRILHFTVGTPCFPEYENCEGSDEWWAVYQRMIAPVGG